MEPCREIENYRSKILHTMADIMVPRIGPCSHPDLLVNMISKYRHCGLVNLMSDFLNSQQLNSVSINATGHHQNGDRRILVMTMLSAFTTMRCLKFFNVDVNDADLPDIGKSCASRGQIAAMFVELKPTHMLRIVLDALLQPWTNPDIARENPWARQHQSATDLMPIELFETHKAHLFSVSKPDFLLNSNLIAGAHHKVILNEIIDNLAQFINRSVLVPSYNFCEWDHRLARSLCVK